MTREEARKKASALVKQMTLEEKASQMTHWAAAIDRLGVHAFTWWNEALHGVARADVATVFPQAIGLAATFDPDLIEEVADMISTEGRAKYQESAANGDYSIYKGLTYWSPNINIFRDPRWGRGQETYGEDPYLTAELGMKFVKGLQGDGEFLKSAACAKHYAVHSGPEKLRHSFDAKCSKQDLWETYLPAFEKLVCDAKVEGVMGAYNRTNGELCCAHSYLMDEVLYKKWGFEGYFTSDCGALCDFHEYHKVTENIEQSAALALEKGCNLNCGNTYENIKSAVDKGLVDEATVDKNLIRLFTTRYLLGEFEEKQPYSDIPFEMLDCEEHCKKNREVARRSLVLLKNDGILPLEKEKLHSIAVIGPNAMSIGALVGNYNGTASEYVTVTDGIRRTAPNARIHYSTGCRVLDHVDETTNYNLAISAAKHSEVAIVCLGLDAGVEGEELLSENDFSDHGDKTGVKFPTVQLEMLQAVMDVCQNVIVVQMAGSSEDLGKDLRQRANAIVQAWYPGARGGEAIADLLFGSYAPSGRLPITFYDSDKQLPDFCDYAMDHRTYRFLDDTPIFPFGYGLSYVKFEYANAELIGEDENAYTVRVDVTNTGNMDAREITQLYAKYTDSAIRTPNFQLCGIASTQIKAGQTVTLCMKAPKYWLKAVNENGDRVTPDTSLCLYVGGGQPDARTAELTGTKCLEIRVK